MTIIVNRGTAALARQLISDGKVNRSSAWTFTDADAQKILGNPPDWLNFSRHHLGYDEEAAKDTPGRHLFPIIKDGMLYQAALEVTRMLAEQAGLKGVMRAAESLYEATVDGSSRNEVLIETKDGISFEIKSVDETGRFLGYASTFNTGPDSYGDVIAPGAFTDSLKAHKAAGTFPAMLYSHNTDWQCGEWLSMVEDKKGLAVEGELWIKGPYPDENGLRAHRGMMAKHSKMGLSIGYRAQEWEYDADNDIRTLTKIDLWEVSPCVFPANRNARVIGVKQRPALINLRGKTPREVEMSLRDAGVSREDAKALVAGGFKALGRTRDERSEDAIKELQSALDAFRRNFPKLS